MSKAIKCERCGRFEETSSPATLSGNRILNGAVRPYHYPESIDLCDECGKELNETLKDFFSPDKPKQGEAQ